jgi:transposase InsO family protein
MYAKFTARFRATLESDDLEVVRVGPKKPNLNAFAERFVQTIRRECLDHFVCFGVDYLRHIVKRFESFYNLHRPHQGRDNRTLPEAAGEEPATFPFARGRVSGGAWRAPEALLSQSRVIVGQALTHQSW